MGENDESLPNGLLPGSGLVVRSLDEDRWGKAEERIAELIACIQPNQLSEERRNSVADYVQRLIMKCFPCQVCTFGSVPLKTYLPDGDIDLTAFSHNQISNDTWANQVRDMLESEEKNDNSEFHVKEVQYIQAEVKIIKCLVENIVVDISFNQVGGLCTLCFLDEIDSLINQNHLFKRSIILIKAWCYYESRILGAHHGLISTYALETLVLYIFHVFNNSFHGPLEVLYRFLEFFSNFDWDNFCVSLWGPVPLSSLPDVTAAPPRKDSGELLLNKVFLDACSSVYAVIPGGQENNGQPFVSKHFNVIDPLRVNNNLGRSVSKGNFFRIRSAFAFGAKKLARLLDCPKENLIFEVNQFFMNTWDRHGSGDRPDAPEIDSWHLRSSTPDSSHEIRSSNNYNYNDNTNTNTNTNNNNNNNNNNYSNSKKAKEDSRVHAKKSSRATSGLKSQVRVSDKIERGNNTIPEQVILSDRSQKDSVNDTQGRLLFARTHSSPELTDDYIDVSSHVQRNRGMENADSRKKIFGPDGLSSHDTRSSVEDAIGRPHPNNSQKSPDTYTDSSSVILNSYHRDSGLDGLSDEFSASSGAQPMMNQEEQDIVNMMASTSLQSFNGQHHAPFNLTSGHLPYSIPPSFLASMGYTQRNFPGFIPANIPFMDPSFPHMQFPQGLVSPQMTTHYFPSIGLNNNPSEDSVEMNTVEVDSDFWKEQDVGPCGENEDLDTFQSVENKSSASSNSSLKYIPQSSRDIGSSNAGKTEPKHIWGKREAIRENMENPANSEVYAEEKPVSTRFSSASHSNSLQSQTSSESSWDGSSVKVASKSSKDKRGKKKNSTDVTAGHGKGKVMTGHICNDTNVVDHEWGPSVGSGTVDDFQVHNRQNNSEVAQTSGSDLMTPFAPMFVNPRSRQRTKDNSGLIAFYPTGPPIPFLTMLPVYNIPPEAGTSDASNGHFGGDETLDNSESGMSCNPKGHDTSVDSIGFERGTTASEKSEEHKSDILNSDFASHWHNLQFGRFCQNSRNQGPSFYPSPMMVPPVYVQGQLPYDNTSRPLSTDTNLIPQLVTSYGHRMVPVAPVQPGSSRNSNVYQSYIDDMPRFRGGTGTYLPNPVFSGWQLFKDHPENKAPVRDRHSFSSRRGNYNHDRNDTFGHREGNWNANPKLRSASRNHNRSQSENKINSRNDRFTHGEGRADRSWNSYRHNSTIPSYQAQNRQLLSGSSQNEPQNVSYGIYPWGAMNPNGVSNGSSGPPVVMVYPFDHNGGTYGSQIEKLEFGSLDPIGFPGVNDQSQQNDGAVARSVEDHILHGSSGYQSSPEQPSSPCHQRRV